MLKFKNHIENNKVKDAYIVLCELFSHLCEHKKYIDVAIYNKLLDFKKIFDSNLEEKTTFLLLKNFQLKNKELVQRSADEIVKVLTLKNIEIKD